VPDASRAILAHFEPKWPICHESKGQKSLAIFGQKKKKFLFSEKIRKKETFKSALLGLPAPSLNPSPLDSLAANRAK